MSEEERRQFITNVRDNIRFATEAHASPMPNETRTMFATSALAGAMTLAADAMVVLAEALLPRDG